jgi:hypothetical protein
MDRAQLLTEFTGARAEPGEAVFVERRGEDYRWSLLPPDEVPVLGADAAGDGTPGPDAWIIYSGGWPADRPDAMAPFLDDLLAEMESMCGGADRCRWPLDQPYPPRH